MKGRQMYILGIGLGLLFMCCGVIATADNNTTSSGSPGIPQWVWAIIGGLAQLVIGVGLAIVAIYLGLNVL
ncbi:MAG: hypothetical protein QXD15_07055, partial [Thermoplasmata archaeon]